MDDFTKRLIAFTINDAKASKTWLQGVVEWVASKLSKLPTAGK